MDTKNPDPSKPVWDCDQLDSPLPLELKAPYFDDVLDAWVLSRYADVMAAFHSPELYLVSPKRKKNPERPNEEARRRIRTETLEALSPHQLREWREKIALEAKQLANALPSNYATDLVSDFGRPLCLSLAAMATGVSSQDANHFQEVASPVLAAAAEPFDPALRAQADAANMELRKHFDIGPITLRDSGFVALAHTLPCLLANAWFALLQHPDEWSRLHHAPDLIAQATEELLRYAGLARILFREASADADLNGTKIRKGERLILRIFAANRDPERFSQPNQLDVTRTEAGHLTLGAGAHACAGAQLIRTAAIAITRPLIETFAAAKLDQPVEWLGGSGFRAPIALHVTLHKHKAEQPLK
jgi:cytochrome P450